MYSHLQSKLWRGGESWKNLSALILGLLPVERAMRCLVLGMLFRLRHLVRHLNHSKSATTPISRALTRSITGMSSNTNKACCTIPPVSSKYEPIGKYLEPGYGLGKTYVVGPDNSETAIICKFNSPRNPNFVTITEVHRGLRQPLSLKLYH